MPEQLDPQYLLNWAGGFSKTHSFIDFHVHPFDVFSGDTGYLADPMINGLFIKGSAINNPAAIEINEESNRDRFAENADISRAILLSSRITYRHTGPKVFTDQLDLAGITRALLLPVVRVPNKAMEMVERSVEIFQQENRLLQACPFPVGVAPHELNNYYSLVKKTKKICAIKIHPNLVGIDPLTNIGKELIEATLISAEKLRLPVIIHGGLTAGLSSPESKGYGTLGRLDMINWSISSCPVIIAHAGCYGLTEDEMSSSLPILNRLLDKNRNLYADTSALDLPALQLLLTKVDRKRLIFGSDALYFKIWKTWITFLQALQAVSSNPDDDLIRIASLNPSQCLVYAGHSPS